MMKKFVSMTLIAAMFLVAASAQAKLWKVPAQFPTINAALLSSRVVNGDVIQVGPGNFDGAFIRKSVEIRGVGGATITGGPAHGSGMIMGFRLMAGSAGANINHLNFDVDLPIMNGDGVNGVTVAQCTFLNSVQAVTNWRGSNWLITQNDIVDLSCSNGGGIGILLGDFTGGEVTGNVVSHNKISGTLYVDPADLGGYDGTGIVIYADYRWGAPGAAKISGNSIINNSVELVSDTPDVVNVNGIELTQAYYPVVPPSPDLVIFDNAIGFNDLRGTAQQIVLTPAGLDEVNDISRNLGENRGHGLSPKLLGPGR